MVKAKFKRVNYTDVAQESPIPGRGASASAQGAPTHVSSQAEKAAEISLAGKKAGKRVADPPAEAAKKLSEKEVMKKRPSKAAAEGSKKKQRVVVSTQKSASVEVAATGSEEGQAAYDLSHALSYAPISLASMEHFFSEPDDLIEAEAYQLFTGSIMEMITHGNLIIEKYDCRSRGLLKKLEDYPSVKKEAKKVPGLEKKVAA
ncbi:unnamed protein product [Arabis nemorensis]|uniref:Uncharacterized protein n=1 Tax=Arabis nemorensis TaxID=586526 RepID=A0A565CMP1_9BRAS|nr:unnamed protein product [Arabis nemorensis]